MAASTISATEDFLRHQFGLAVEDHRPIGPVTRTVLETLLTETASHVGAEELKGSNAADGNRFVVRLALGVLTQRYSHEVVMLILSLDNGTAR